MKKRKLRRIPVAPASCPCGSRAAYSACCAPLHEGSRHAANPVELVRSRFSAFATGRADYLFATLHSSHDDRARGQDAFAAALKRALNEMRYRAVRILDSRDADGHGIAQVLFSVEVTRQTRDASFVEQSDFAQEDGQWRYLLGELRSRSELSHPLSSMTLDHWQCAHHHH